MSDTPETDALVERHQKEIADLPMNPPIEVALRLSQNHCLALMSLAQSAERERDALKAELAAVREDAERYRWLRDKKISGETLPTLAYFRGDQLHLCQDSSKQVDAAIDAERKP